MVSEGFSFSLVVLQLAKFKNQVTLALVLLSHTQHQDLTLTCATLFASLPKWQFWNQYSCVTNISCLLYTTTKVREFKQYVNKQLATLFVIEMPPFIITARSIDTFYDHWLTPGYWFIFSCIACRRIYILVIRIKRREKRVSTCTLALGLFTFWYKSLSCGHNRKHSCHLTHFCSISFPSNTVVHKASGCSIVFSTRTRKYVP